MQDSFVLSFLTDVLQSKIKHLLPTLAEQLAQTSLPNLAQGNLQQQYLNLETRRLFLAILQYL